MRIDEIRNMRTVVDESMVRMTQGGVHESVLRAYNILEKVRKYLSQGVPPAVVLELIDEMEGSDKAFGSE